jgi:predicted phosphohydrolase
VKRELLWATDVHLDHVGHPGAAFQFARALRGEHPTSQGLLLTGDIAEAPTVLSIVRDVKKGFEGPVFFVLGNHDYYGSSFSAVDARLNKELPESDTSPHWLRRAPVWLSDDTVLLGNGGFYDGRYGDQQSSLELTDFRKIEDLFTAQDESRRRLFSVMAQRTDSLVAELAIQMEAILRQDPRVVIIATHVPPYREAAFYKGEHSDNQFAPFFSSQAMGELLTKVASENEQTRFLTLCGHTHGSGRYQARTNLEVVTGAARYGAPDLAGIVEIDEGQVTHLKLG